MTGQAPAAGEGRRRIRSGERVAARDGVALATDVYLPPGEEPAPVLLVRTPYGRGVPPLMRLALRLNREGVGVAIQDCRGRHGSEGELEWRREPGDARDALAWLGERSWCSGRVGLLGLSISSLALFKVAAEEPPPGVELAAMVNVMGAVDLHRLFYRQGAMVLHWALPWLHIVGSRRAAAPVRADGRGWEELYRWQPLAELPPAEGFDQDFWRAVLEHPRPDAFWRAYDAGGSLAEVRVPVLHLAGWFDFMLGQTLAAWRGLAGRGPQAAADRLVIGPWDHQNLLAALVGGAAPAGGPDLMELTAGWLRRRLLADARAADPAGAEEPLPRALYSIQESDAWLGGSDFPPPGAATEEWFLETGGGLVRRVPGAGEDRFVYDPADPPPPAGGAVWPFPAAGLAAGRADQTAVEARPDVLVYTSEALVEDRVAAGPVEVELWVASSARDADFAVKLVDVDAAGRPWIAQDGIVRARYRDRDSEQWLEPGRPVRLAVDLDAAGHRFAAGHRLRLEVSGGCFPKFDRNPDAAEAGGTVQQTVFSGGDRPSRLRLAVLPAGALEAARWRAAPGARPPAGHRLRRRLGAATTRLRATVRDQFSRPSGGLGRLVGFVLAMANRKINRWTLTGLEAAPGDQLLEIGFGPGLSIRRSARLADRVAGIDVSEVMLDQARRRNRAAVAAGRVDLRRGSVEELPWEDGAFDRVYAVNSVQVWPDLDAGLAEVRRVLRPGGRLVLTVGQPRWAKDAETIRRMGETTARRVGAAGFSEVELEVRRIGGMNAFRLRAVLPAP